MKHNETKPCQPLENHIHSFWELKGDDRDKQWERLFPDGCPGIVVNLGAACKTDNGQVTMDHGKTYVVGAMTTYKDSFIDSNTHLLGVCLKPAAFSALYHYAPQRELTNHTIEFERHRSLDSGQLLKSPYAYLNRYFLDRRRDINGSLQLVLHHIHEMKGNVRIREAAKNSFTTIRQLERNFKTHIGITPKEYAKIVRFQSALAMLRDDRQNKDLSAIAFDSGFYDQAHMVNEIKLHTGLTPSQL